MICSDTKNFNLNIWKYSGFIWRVDFWLISLKLSNIQSTEHVERYANLKLIVDFYYYICVYFISFCACLVFVWIIFVYFWCQELWLFHVRFFFSFSFFLENIKFYWCIVLLCIDPPTSSKSYVCTIIIVDHKSGEFEFRSWRGNIVLRD
jgi:hypothetical protein